MRESTESPKLHNVSQIVERYPKDKEMLIQILLDIQNEFGWLPREVLIYISKRLNTPVSNLYRIASFYREAFDLIRRGKYLIQICNDEACRKKGSEKLFKTVERILNIGLGETTSDNRFTLALTRCMRRCSKAPVIKIQGEKYFSVPFLKNFRRHSGTLILKKIFKEVE